MRIKHDTHWIAKMMTTGRKGFIIRNSLIFRDTKLISSEVDEKIYDDTERGVFDTSHLKPTLHRLINEKI